MPFKLVVLWTDSLVYLLVLSAIAFILWAKRKAPMRSAWRQVMRNRLAVISLIVLTVYVAIGLLDSIHYRQALNGKGLNGEVHYASQVQSVFDRLIQHLKNDTEKTYSAPFAIQLYVKEPMTLPDGKQIRAYPRLEYGGANLKTISQRSGDIQLRILKATVCAVIAWSLLTLLVSMIYARKRSLGLVDAMLLIRRNNTALPLRLMLTTSFVLLLFIFIAVFLAAEYHVFGTDKVGQDVFYQTLKSIRTGLVIGTLTTLIMLPFAILLGIMAGFFGGLIDDVIQYIYTTLSSIPGVLLIAAAVLSLQIFISNHPDVFQTLADRADARLLALCIILGVTSWTGLCRLLRAETLKTREMDYVHAATALGTKRFSILMRHILPNVMHIVLIAVVLDFSTLVLAEAVLSYVGVGVDPSSISWGNMINAARLELAREPVVWWPLAAAFIFMFMLVLAANLFADAVRDGFDPRIRKL